MQQLNKYIPASQDGQGRGIQVQFSDVKTCPDLPKRLLHIYERAIARHKENTRETIRSTNDE